MGSDGLCVVYLLNPRQRPHYADRSNHLHYSIDAKVIVTGKPKSAVAHFETSYSRPLYVPFLALGYGYRFPWPPRRTVVARPSVTSREKSLTADNG